MEPAVRALLVGLSEDNHREGLRQTSKRVAKAFHDGDRECDVSSVVVYAKFLLHRVVFFVLGLVLMVVAHTLSEFVVFYYGGAMTIGIFLVILIILFQGMKLLPTGRKSSLAIFAYSLVYKPESCTCKHTKETKLRIIIVLGPRIAKHVRQ